MLDLGCGTGTFALLLADRGFDVTGLDPAAASLDVARSKPGAERVRWLHADATGLPSVQVDLVTMTGNVAQAIVEPAAWAATLSGAHAALRPGRLAFETRDPAFEGWTEWNRPASYRRTRIDGVGAVDSWVDLLEVDLPIVRFRWTYLFGSDGTSLSSDCTLRFRERDEIQVAQHGFTVEDVRDAPDRPGREFVFIARRSS